MTYQHIPKGAIEFLKSKDRQGDLARRICRIILEKSGKTLQFPFIGFHAKNSQSYGLNSHLMTGYSDSEVHDVLYSLKDRGLISEGCGDFGVCSWGFAEELRDDGPPFDNEVYIKKNEPFREEMRSALEEAELSAT